MGYIDKILMPDEQVIYRTRLHWLIFVIPCIILIIGIILSILSLSYSVSTILILGLIIIAIGLIYLLISYINYITSEFGVTNKRVIFKKGILRRQTLDVILPKVESIEINQGLFSRIIDKGSLIVRGSGVILQQFSNVNHPLRFRENIINQTNGKEI